MSSNVRRYSAIINAKQRLGLVSLEKRSAVEPIRILTKHQGTVDAFTTSYG